MKEPNIQLAKKRIWNRLKSELPERGLSVYQNEIDSLRSQCDVVQISTLKKVQGKEVLLDMLPDRVPVQSLFMSKKVFAFVSLCVLFSVLLVPVLRFSPSVSAMPTNTLSVVEGDVYVNGKLAQGSLDLQVGDKVETGDDAMAHVTFVDDSRLTMGPSTVINIVDASFDPLNTALTKVSVYQEKGRSFSQIVSLIAFGSLFEVDFPGGYVVTTQKSSFDLQVNDDVKTVMVARNFVNTVVNSGGDTYSGVVGQGATIVASDVVESSVLPEDLSGDVWWTFNMAYSKSYARQLDESYKRENVDRALILPGNPLYFLKTFRETVQVSFALTDSAKTDLLVEQAENRLNEAQTLIANGDTELAKQTLDVYQDTVTRAMETSGGEENQKLVALVLETQKEASVTPNIAEGDALLEDQLSTSSLDVGLMSASQKLQQVPELIDAGLLEDAVSFLDAYQKDSMSLLSNLQDMPMEERDATISKLLDQKLSDLQMLRVIAALPELQDRVDVEDAIMEQLSMMVLSLRERELKDLSDFFGADVGSDSSYDLYTKLKDSSQISEDLSDQFDTVEEQISSQNDDAVLLDIEQVFDPRFDD